MSQSVGNWFQDMPVTRTHWLAGGVLFGSFIFESWEMMILIFNSGSIATEFGLDTAQIGSLIGALFLGMIPGSLMWGKIADRFGRKRSIMLSFMLYAPLPLLCAFAPSYEVLWWLRLVCGVVLSGALVITFPYFEELIPVPVRGQATVYLSAGWPMGLLIAVAISALLVDSGWRWALGFSSVSILWVFALARWVPESPYWLAEKGELERSASVIARLSNGAISANVSKPQRVSGDGTSLFAIFKSGSIRITLLQTLVNFCFSWGYWALASWMPTLLAKRGLSAPEGLGFIALSTAFMFPGYISASYLTARYGRKKTMLAYVFIAAIAGFGFATANSLYSMYAWNFTLSFFSLGAWGVWNTWMGEIYSTRMRGSGVAWGVSMQRVANAIAPIVIGAMLTSATFLQTVSFISAFLAATFITAMFLPETEGKILD
jgi:putative MFS transporter